MKDRDRIVGELLDQLDPQPPRPGFRSELRAQLRDDLYAPNALERQETSVKTGGIHMKMKKVQVAAAVALAIVIGGGTFAVWTNQQDRRITHQGSNAPETTALKEVPLSLAARVRAKSIEAVTRATSLSGTVSYQQYTDGKPNGAPITVEFHVDSGGDRWARAVSSGEIDGKPFRDVNETSFNVGTGTLTDLWTGTSGNHATITERADQGSSLFKSVLTRDVFSDVVRTMDASGEAEVKEITHNGRPAWQFEPKDESSSLIIDQETGFPVQGTSFHEGKVTFSFTATELKVNPGGNPKSVTIPRGTTVDRRDEEFQVVTRDEVVARANLHPYLLEPEPTGFVLQSLMVQYAGGDRVGTKRPVKAIYRRGLQTMVVSTWPNQDGTAEANDPIYIQGLDGYASPSDVSPIATLDRGAFAGSKLRAITKGDEDSHVWVSTRTSVAVIMGSLSNEQFVELANTLAEE